MWPRWLVTYRDGMRVFATTLAVMLTLLVCSSLAFAGWSAPQSFGVSRYGHVSSALAVDARGDAAVAWATGGSMRNRPFRTSVNITARTAGGRLSTRTVWSSNNAELRNLSVVLGAGEVTVVWDSRSRAEAKGTTTVIRAAYGPLIGRWRPPRVIRRIPYEPSYPPIPWDQHLAVAPNGEVLLAFNALDLWSHVGPRGVAVTWRAPGHHFGTSKVLRNAPGGAIPQFDARGTAYLNGYCNGFVMTAPAHSHRFGRTVVLTPRQVLGFTLSLAGAGHGLAAWIAGECSFDAAAGNTPGPVFASVLSAGTFGKPLRLTPAVAQAYSSNSVAVPGGGTVTWGATYYNPFLTGIFSVQIGADGLPGATQQITSGSAAVTADGGGDEVFTPSPPAPHPVFIRPAGGGADQPAPKSPGSPGGVAVAAPVGRAVAAVWNTSPTGGGPTMALSVWRP